MQTIKLGSKGSAVRTLQQYLNLYPDGIFGKLTDEAFRKWQKSHGLIDDGICGPKSWSLISTTTVPDASPSVATVPDASPSATVPGASPSVATVPDVSPSVATVPDVSPSVATVPDVSPSVLKQGDAIPLINGSLSLSHATRRITDIILHCTATREGRDYTVADIKNWHTMPKSKGGRGWSDIGYHYVIYRDGSIHIGRNINVSGAHCENHNTNTIGIVYVGGCPSDTVKVAKDTRTSAQKESLQRLVRQLLQLYGLSKSNVHGHCEYSSKACPSFNMIDFRKDL